MPLFLTDDELQQLTGKKRHGAQFRALRQIGLECRQRPDGFPLVLRAHVEKELGYTGPSRQKQMEPDWEAVD